jgi:hypothetical protein
MDLVGVCSYQTYTKSDYLPGPILLMFYLSKWIILILLMITYATQCTHVTYCTYCTVMVAWLDKSDPKII